MYRETHSTEGKYTKHNLLIYILDAYHTVVVTYHDVVFPWGVQEEANNSWKNLVSTSNILKIGVK